MATRGVKTIQIIMFLIVITPLWILFPGALAKAQGVHDSQKAITASDDHVPEKIVAGTEEKTAERVADKAVAKAMEKAEEKSQVKEKLTSKRPAEWAGPTRIHYNIFVVDIDGINDAEQNFTANVYIRLRWRDYRLAKPGSSNRQMWLNEVWNPRVLLANQQGIMPKSLPEIVQVAADGTVVYHQRYTGRLSQPLRLVDFPMDEHSFTIQFVAAGYDANELHFEPELIHGTDGQKLMGGEIADELSLPDWEVLSYQTSNKPYTPVARISAASFSLTFIAKRYVGYFLWQVVLPLGVVIVMSWAAFWVDRSNVGARVGVATSSILTLIAYRFILANLLPRLPYMTRMDYFTVCSTVLVLMALIVVLCTSFLGQQGHNKASRIVDNLARAGFPLMFAALLAWFLSAL
jgi:hypothetical protein